MCARSPLEDENLIRSVLNETVSREKSEFSLLKMRLLKVAKEVANATAFVGDSHKLDPP